MNRKLPFNLDEAARLTALFMLFVLGAAVALLLASWHSSLDARKVEGQRINQALVAALDHEKIRAAKYLLDHDDWDDEILEEGGSIREQGKEFRFVDADGNFDAMWLLDSAGRDKLAFLPEEDRKIRLNAPTKSDALPEFAAQPEITERLIAKSRSVVSGPVVKIIKHHEKASIYVLVRLDEGNGFASVIGSKGTGFLVLREDISGSFLEGVRQSMQLSSLEILPSDSELGQVPIHDASGLLVARLGWTTTDVSGPFAQGRMYFVFAIAVLMVTIGFVGTRHVASSFRSLSRQAKLDHLSKLPNRFELLRLMRLKRDVEDFAALALIDLDSFKSINDFHGHRTGDAVIRHVARLLRECAPANSTVARLGGDEFAVFFPCDGDRAEEHLLRFLLKLSEPADVDGCALRLGASIGLTKLGTSRHAAEGLRQADIAMYAAKKRGKMQIVNYDESMEAPLREMLSIKDELFTAIVEKQISVKYQPIISTRTGEIETLEALARWASPVRGNVAADLFIKVAEEFGLIGKLGEQILQQVIDDLERLPNVRVALNVSTAQIATFEFTELLERHILSGRISGDLFDIEITETHLVHDPEIIHEVMTRLSKLGVRFVLDDFGTGYASIGFLRQFPFSAVKIDRSLIDECLVSKQTRAVLASIVAMAHAFDMVVVAEGIETERHEALARASGCDQMQGWHFGRAVSPGDRTLQIPTRAEAHAA